LGFALEVFDEKGRGGTAIATFGEAFKGGEVEVSGFGGGLVAALALALEEGADVAGKAGGIGGVGDPGGGGNGAGRQY